MNIGILKEIKPNEHRVPLVPQGAVQLTRGGHQVLVETGAGVGAGFGDAEYTAIGAGIETSAEAVCRKCDIVLKVKEPVPEEFHVFREGQGIFCYLHSETRPPLIKMLLEKRITAIAFENVRLPDNRTPLLAPMSIIAGQQGVLQGMMFLCNHKGGSGISLVAYPGLAPAEVVVIGAGQAGLQAAQTAAALGASVSLFEIDRDRIRGLFPLVAKNIRLLHIESTSIAPYVRNADMVVNAATIPPGSSTHLIDRKLISEMKKGSVIVDVTANIRGAVETVDRYTTHDDPVWIVEGVIHYAVTNIPGTVAHTASSALSLEVLPYLKEIADKGVIPALKENPALQKGLTAVDGKLTWHEAGEYQNMDWISPEAALNAIGK